MIEETDFGYVISCDVCDCEEDLYHSDFKSALATAKARGWKMFNRNGWKHLCQKHHEAQIPAPALPVAHTRRPIQDGTASGKTCPNCAAQLVVRTNGENGSQFLGCTSYPECRYSEPISEEWRMRLTGAPTLPRME